MPNKRSRRGRGLRAAESESALLNKVASNPLAFAKGIGIGAFAAAPDIVGMATQGVNSRLNTLFDTKRNIPVISGDPLRGIAGTDNTAGLAGEFLDPLGKVAKVASFAGDALRHAPELAMSLFGVSKFGGDSYPLAARSRWYADADFEARGGTLGEMTPDEFLGNASPLDIDDIARENIDDLKQHISDGGELDPLTLYGDKSSVRNSDGRHRAIAAKELGIDTVPVLDLRPSMREGEQVLSGVAKGDAGIANVAKWKVDKRRKDALNPPSRSEWGDETIIRQSDGLSVSEQDFTGLSGGKRSIRYVALENGEPIGVLQIMTDGPRTKKAQIIDTYVISGRRRQGVASGLLEDARKDFIVSHSTDLTDAGKSFKAANP